MHGANRAINSPNPLLDGFFHRKPHETGDPTEFQDPSPHGFAVMRRKAAFGRNESPTRVRTSDLTASGRSLLRARDTQPPSVLSSLKKLVTSSVYALTRRVNGEQRSSLKAGHF